MTIPEVPVPTTEFDRDERDDKVWHDIEVAGKQCFLKRSLGPTKFNISPLTHKLRYPSSDLPNRMRNEKGAIDFVRKNTNIPVPNILFYIDEGDRVWLCTEKVEGIPFHHVKDKADRAKVAKQLHAFMEESATHRSPEIKGFAITPSFHQEIEKYPKNTYPVYFKHDFEHGYPLCHGDLHRGNVIVDPDTMEVKAIIDWEHCGYYPPEVDCPRYRGEQVPAIVVRPDGTTLRYGEWSCKAAQKLDELKIGWIDYLTEKKKNGDGEAAKRLDEIFTKNQQSWEESQKEEQDEKKSAPSAAPGQTSGDASAKE